MENFQWFDQSMQVHDENSIERVESPSFPKCSFSSLEKLKDELLNDSTFEGAKATLKYWLSQGEVNRLNKEKFVNLLFIIAEKVNALNAEKMKSDLEIDEAKLKQDEKMEDTYEILKGFDEVLRNALHKRVSDHLQRKQRKRLKSWKEETEKLLDEHSEELRSQRKEPEMEVSDVEEESPEVTDISAIKEKLDIRLCHKAALEAKLIKVQEEKDRQIADETAAVQKIILEKNDLLMKMEELKKDLPIRNKGIATAPEETNAEKDAPLNLSEQNLHLIALLTPFLNLHNNGASILYLVSFLNDCGQTVTPADLEKFFRTFPNLFVEETTGVGASIKKVWKYVWPVCPDE